MKLLAWIIDASTTPEALFSSFELVVVAHFFDQTRTNFVEDERENYATTQQF